MDYQIMEEFEEDTQVYGDTPGGDMHMMNQQEMPVERKLQLAERANEIYREQVKYLQEHLNNIRALVQDKESIIENLMLRYDLGILLQDPSRGAENIPSDKIEDKELRRKAEALAQRTILENFELRELVNELRDENFHLRNEIYDLQDRLNRQALHISKMTKNAQNQPNQYTTQPNYEMNDYGMVNGNHPDAVNEEAQRKREERAEKHKRQQSSIAQPQDFWNSGMNPEEEEEDPESDEEKPRKVARNTGDEDDAREQEQDQENTYMDEAAKKKHQERQEKSHEKKESVAAPEQFFEDGYSPDKAANGNNNDRPNKRRGSKQLDGDPTQTEEAKAKRQERQEKAKTRQDSVAAPNGMFETDPANTEEAKKVREERAKKIRKESIALPKGFLNADDPNGSEDDASREKRRKHQRKQSLMKAVGDKGHLSDEDTEKTQHVDYETRKKSGLVDRSRQKGKEAGGSEKPDDQNKTTHHRRESSMPMPDLKFEDPNTLLAMAQEEVKDLKQKLTTIEQEKKTAEKQLQDNKKETEQLEQKLSQQLEQKIAQQVEKRLEDKFQKEKHGLLANNKKDLDQLNTRIDDLKNQLTQATTSKVTLIECTSHEINRLNRVINGLLQSERCKEITRLILEDNGKQT